MKRLHAPSILIAEDDKQALAILQEIIPKKFTDVEVFPAQNGEIGLKLFKAYSPGIVITDINMPEMDGVEMARQIKAMDADTKIIVLTGYADTHYKEDFTKIGYHDFFTKPVDFRKLFASIERCLTEMDSESGRKLN